jgi:hypothetical protein
MENENENRNEDVIRNKDVVKKEKKPREKFVRPTLDEVRQFAESEMMGSKELPEKFFYHYEANGWMINKVQMKNWQAAFRNWNKRESNGTYQQPISRQSTGETKQQQRERAWEEFGTNINEGRGEFLKLFGGG